MVFDISTDNFFKIGTAAVANFELKQQKLVEVEAIFYQKVGSFTCGETLSMVRTQTAI